jgi:hypothetical protein
MTIIVSDGRHLLLGEHGPDQRGHQRRVDRDRVDASPPPTWSAAGDGSVAGIPPAHGRSKHVQPTDSHHVLTGPVPRRAGSAMSTVGPGPHAESDPVRPLASLAGTVRRLPKDLMQTSGYGG